MGMSSPAMPEYEELAAQREQDRIRNEAQKTQYVNYNSGLGGYSWNPETQTIDVNYNMPDKERLALIGSGIGDINLNVTEATDKYFQNTLQNLQPQIDLYRSKVSSDLINKGIPVGSRAYNQVQEEMDKNITRELENAYVESRSRALADTNAQIGNIGSLQSQIYQPTAYAGIGATGLANAYDQKMQNLYDVYNAQMGSKNSKTSSILGGIGTIAGGAIGAYFGGPAGMMVGSSLGGAAGQTAGSIASN